jgi:hypothetical protein
MHENRSKLLYIHSLYIICVGMTIIMPSIQLGENSVHLNVHYYIQSQQHKGLNESCRYTSVALTHAYSYRKWLWRITMSWCGQHNRHRPNNIVEKTTVQQRECVSNNLKSNNVDIVKDGQGVWLLDSFLMTSNMLSAVSSVLTYLIANTGTRGNIKSLKWVSIEVHCILISIVNCTV